MFASTESRMAAFEHLDGLLLPPEVHTIVRLELDGPEREALFDDDALGLGGLLDGRFGKAVLKAGAFVVRQNPESLFAYAAGAEVSVLLDVASFLERRSPRSLVARFAAQASAKASVVLHRPTRFDCHVYTFPTDEQAADYFGWRQQAHTDRVLTLLCEQAMVANGADAATAARTLGDLPPDEKLAVLEENAVDWEALPAWRRRGSGIYWGEAENGAGASIIVDADLPEAEEYRAFLARFWA